MAKKNTESNSITRRNFFKKSTIGLGSLLTVMIGYPLISSIVTQSKSIIKGVFSKIGLIKEIPNSFSPVKNPTKKNFTLEQQDAYVTFKEPEDIWVVKKSEEDLKVFSPICPHLGCRYGWDSDRKLFVCPCHNSVYTIEGDVVSGPAPRGLDTLPQEVKNGNLYVKYEKFEVGIPEKKIIGT